MGFEIGNRQARLRGGSEQVALLTAFAVFALVGAAMVFSGQPSAVVLGAAVAVLGAVVCIRCLRAEVRANDDGLVVRGLLRTHEFDWTDVAEAKVVATNSNGLFAILLVIDRRGHRLKVDGIGYWLPGRSVEDSPVALMAGEINRRVPGTSSDPC